MKVLLLFACFSLLLGPRIGMSQTAKEGNFVRDGNWWRSQSATRKQDYVLGLMDGIRAGQLIVGKELDNHNFKDCADKADRALQDAVHKYIGKATVGQVADGLDDFYKDFRNRSIAAHHAVYPVYLSIAGAPKETVDAAIQGLRHSSAQRQPPAR